MKDLFRRDGTSPATLLQLVFRRGLPLERETAFFILASALDVWMTYLLLTHTQVLFVESNPVARYFLESWGMRGMVYFKFALVAFVAVICQWIATRRPHMARGLLWGATAVVSSVVLYSLVLLLQHTPGAGTL